MITPGSSATPGISMDNVIDLTLPSPPPPTAATAVTNEKTGGGGGGQADARLLASLVADLACSVCGKLTGQAQLEPDGKTMNANVLVECAQCGALFHQLCHQPPVLSGERGCTGGASWSCSRCAPRIATAAAAAAVGGKPAAPAVTVPIDMSGSVVVTNVVQRRVIQPSPTVGARKRKTGISVVSRSSQQ